jgi:hypothetical protein
MMFQRNYKKKNNIKEEISEVSWPVFYKKKKEKFSLPFMMSYDFI